MAILIPYEYESLSQRLVWHTDVLKATDGLENRVSLLAFPREYLQIEYLLDEVDARDMRRELFLDPQTEREIPMRPDSLVATVIASTAITVTSTALVDWAVAGRRVMLETVDAYLTATIDTIGGGGTVINLTAIDGGSVPTDGTYKAGTSWIQPLLLVTVEDRVATERMQDAAVRVRVAARVAEFASVMGTGISLTSFDGYPVMDRRPAVGGGAREQNDGGLDVLDFGGVHEVQWRRDFSDIVREHEWVYSSATDRQWFRKFLGTVRGRQRPYLLATWADDLLYVSKPSSTTLRISSPPDYDEWFASAGHTHLQLLLTDGTVEYVEVTAVVDAGSVQNLTVTPAMSATAVAKISFLEICRLESDEVAIAHSQAYARLSLAARAVQR